MEERACCRDLLCGVSIIRFQPKCIEKRTVREEVGELRVLRRIPVDSSQKLCELLDMTRLQMPIQKQCFPVVVRLRHRRHRDHMLVTILEQKRRDGAFRSKFLQVSEPERLRVDPARVAKPICGRA